MYGKKHAAHQYPPMFNFFPNVLSPFSSHLKGAKAQIKIRRFKVETRRPVGSRAAGSDSIIVVQPDLSFYTPPLANAKANT